jgi:hypothetical protein
MPKRAEKVEDFENYQSFIATKLGNMKWKFKNSANAEWL